MTGVDTAKVSEMNDMQPQNIPNPKTEDAGLFGSQTQTLLLIATPEINLNNRGDMIVSGYALNDQMRECPVEIVFAGRRSTLARPLQDRLHAMLGHTLEQARQTGMTPFPDAVRLPLQVEGAWRPRSAFPDAAGDEQGHQFIAAQWSYKDVDGTHRVFGDAPAGHDKGVKAAT